MSGIIYVLVNGLHVHIIDKNAFTIMQSNRKYLIIDLVHKKY